MAQGPTKTEVVRTYEITPQLSVRLTELPLFLQLFEKIKNIF